MVNWLLITLVVVGVFVFFKMSPGARYGKIWTFLIGASIIFFVLTFGYVVVTFGDVSSFEDFRSVVKAYFSWLGVLTDNAATITGNVVSTDWSANRTAR